MSISNALRRTPHWVAVSTLLVFPAVSTPSAADPGGPFAGMSGHWSGGGTLQLESGANERISCRADYSVDGSGSSLSQRLTCASDSYKLQISANVAAHGGALSGSWSESVHGEGGSVSGSVSGSTIRAQVHGSSFSAGVGISTGGRSQSVTITPTAGTSVRHVVISLHKG